MWYYAFWKWIILVCLEPEAFSSVVYFAFVMSKLSWLYYSRDCLKHEYCILRTNIEGFVSEKDGVITIEDVPRYTWRFPNWCNAIAYIFLLVHSYRFKCIFGHLPVTIQVFKHMTNMFSEQQAFSFCLYVEYSYFEKRQKSKNWNL